VDPDNLASSFGKGTSLKALTVQITQEPVTVGIKRRLPWADQYRKLHLDGTSSVIENMTAKDLSAHLTPGSFSTEIA
jgi:hypothetical protein